MFFFFSSRRRHTRLQGDWSSDVCSSDLADAGRDVAVRAPIQAPEVRTDAARGLPERFSRTRRPVRWLWLAARVAVAGAIGWHRVPRAPPPAPRSPAPGLAGDHSHKAAAPRDA